MKEIENVSDTGQSSKEQLRSYIERWEKLEEQRVEWADDQKAILDAAKSAGFDSKIMKEVIRLRKLDADERREHDEVLTTYMHALGMLDEEQAA